MVVVPGFATAQDDDPEATIAALETQVSKLQTQVASLTTPTAEATIPAEPGITTLFGDGLGLLPPGEAGTVAVIAVGKPVREALPVAVRNNTGEPVLLNEVIAVARDETGTLIATSMVGTLVPYRIEPGQVAVGDIAFTPGTVLDGLSFEFEVQLDSPDNQFLNRVDLTISEATKTNTGITGLAVNNSDEKLMGPFSVAGLCLSTTGEIRGYYAAFATKMELAPGEETPFTASGYPGPACDAYVIGVTGYKGF